MDAVSQEALEMNQTVTLVLVTALAKLMWRANSAPTVNQATLTLTWKMILDVLHVSVMGMRRFVKLHQDTDRSC